MRILTSSRGLLDVILRFSLQGVRFAPGSTPTTTVSGLLASEMHLYWNLWRNENTPVFARAEHRKATRRLLSLAHAQQITSVRRHASENKTHTCSNIFFNHRGHLHSRCKE